MSVHLFILAPVYRPAFRWLLVPQHLPLRCLPLQKHQSARLRMSAQVDCCCVSVCTYSFFYFVVLSNTLMFASIVARRLLQKKRRRPSTTSKSWVLLLFACLLKIAQHLTRVCISITTEYVVETHCHYTVKNVQRNDCRCWHALLLCALFFMCRRPA